MPADLHVMRSAGLSHLLQLRAQLAIVSGSLVVERQHVQARRKISELSQVPSRAGGFFGTIMQLAERNARNAKLLGERIEFLPQLRVLGGDADRAGVQVADAHHQAAHHDDGGSGEAELLSAQEGAAHHIAAGLQLAVHLNDDAVAEIVCEKRRALGRTAALSFHQFDAGLSDVGGLGELKLWLRERRRAFGSEARAFGLPTPRGLLLLGVQGCGKSLCAKAVAREWHFPLLRLDLAATFSSESQSPEQSIREAVQVAESLAPAVLWIDEIEKGFAASESDPSASRVFGAFLTWLSEKDSPVFVVATANDVTALPPELLRRGRFDDLFFVDLPTENERAEILSIHLRRRGRDPLQVELAELAAQAARLSGAELEQAVTAALYAAFSESRELSETDLENAIHDTVPLYDTYEEHIKELRDWSKGRARPASVDAKMVELFAEP